MNGITIVLNFELHLSKLYSNFQTKVVYKGQIFISESFP